MLLLLCGGAKTEECDSSSGGIEKAERDHAELDHIFAIQESNVAHVHSNRDKRAL